MNGILDLLTGIELHTCNKWWGGTTYGMYASFLSPETEYTKCTTQDLMTYQIMHRGEWMDYNGYILGDCSHFLLNLKNKVHIIKCQIPEYTRLLIFSFWCPLFKLIRHYSFINLRIFSAFLLIKPYSFINSLLVY